MTQPQVRILVVDDERNIRNNLTRYWNRQGTRSMRAEMGKTPLPKCKERHYDIALVDIQMPKMGGLELLRYLRTLRPNLPVVILTAYGTVGRAVEAMKLGAVDFLEKPFDPKVLLLLCEEIIQRQKMSKSVSVDDLLHLAELARERKAYVEARVYLKTAMIREVARPEPYYWLGYVAEAEGDKRRAMQYYSIGTGRERRLRASR
jgi:DNA-binding NtrC family response regulator